MSTSSNSKTNEDQKDKTVGTITRISGPLIQARGLTGTKMYEIVKVSKMKLMGEIIELKGEIASIQVYEDTSGLEPGDIVEATGQTMSVALGPGLLESIYDGIQRPLKEIEKKADSYFITRGIEADGLDREKKWKFEPTTKNGQQVSGGDILGKVQETSTITHSIMVPPKISGQITEIKTAGEYTIEDKIATVKTESGKSVELSMLQYWPIRSPRPTKAKIFPVEPLITGTRSIDTFFPIAKGGAGCIPGAFGTGKTITQQSLAKYSDAQIIVYIGCGERGNEMTEVLNEFPELIDPNTGDPLIRRTVLIANTSNMPVAAREASVYTGITIAEYYRDMGYSVAMMADSTSRWAEAMREIAGRLEEMPGEEGYPAYLASRTAGFYERAGRYTCLGSDDRDGALTVIGAVSPPGGDLSEPVSQATLRVTKCFWGLDASLAYQKHFPSINWLNSYSLYLDNITNYWREKVGQDFPEIRSQAMDLLQQEAGLQEIVRLVGMESLSNSERLVMEIAKSIREDFLFQNAFDSEDAYSSMDRQYNILRSIMKVYELLKPITSSAELKFKDILELPSFKTLPSLKTMKQKEDFDQFIEDAKTEIGGLEQSLESLKENFN